MNDKFQFDDNDNSKEKVEDTIEILSVPEEVGVENSTPIIEEKEKVEDVPKEKIDLGITKKFYFSFEARVIVSIIVILLLFAGACFLGLKVINHTTEKRIRYVENGDIFYYVNLKKDVCTVEQCLTEDYIYNAKDINSIKITYDYYVRYDEKIKNNNYYKVVSIVSKYSKDDHSLISQKSEDLTDKKILPVYNEKYPITEVVNIDYTKYRKNVDASTGEDVQLEVVFYLIQGDETRKVTGLIIPLTKENFEIKKYTTVNAVREVYEKVSIWDTYSLVYGVSASILVLLSLVLVYKTTRLVLKVSNTKSEYETAVDEILKEHESIITVFGEGFDSVVPEEKTVVKLDNFDELVSVNERVGKPIIYSKINNVKCEFVIEDDKALYKYVMKEADFTEEDKNKLENK